ncbi:YigZ family protein [Dasania sp. GY-MA-18]|uniref:YigZ family protein n=1 Tax=Dasania phycosphaerae TaxID=2950436 RepID=A0A9J6RLA4_9GAMM|nr:MULTISPECIES: YigZ family protein [Dasania]MCR8922740.1 YigZ family protein [Dasania sp. GY-MA-18]MCZ0865170.1 YigZ family protein [Dasania phycosphaerae]MCZ0868896.1 YigZ family protein [Dasania phycosphaerae]
MSYLIPQSALRFELEEKRSRFICYLQPVSSRAEALAFLEQLRQQYPDASHHCWAYVIGNPQNPDSMAASDDGEPSGTAGKPMLQVLQYRQIGNIMAVVVRYFGGTRLGAGGLVRAYSAAVQQASEQLSLQRHIPLSQLSLQCSYPCEAIVRHLTDKVQGRIIEASYGADVQLLIELPSAELSAMLSQLGNQAPGQFSHQCPGSPTKPQP